MDDRSAYSYCTLFDKNYLDKGIVTVNSLIESGVNGRIYILAMDQVSFDVLEDYYQDENVYVIYLESFLDDNLRKIQKQRSRAEFCWTCTASLIFFILKNYKEDICTYIDADMYFYSNPDVLVDEMISAGKSVLIVEHRFRENYFGKKTIKTAGRFNVAFNTFTKSNDSLVVLNEWREDTLESCFSYSDDNTNLGDQFYLNEWTKKYDCVHVLQNVGADIAPWNLYRYKYIEDKDGIPVLSFDGKGRNVAVFFHFHNIVYYDRDLVDINVYKYQLSVDKNTTEAFYFLYLANIDNIKRFLEEKYGLYPIVMQHPGVIKTNRSIKYYFSRIFSKQIIGNVLLSARNRISARNAKYDIYSISQIKDQVKLKERTDEA